MSLIEKRTFSVGNAALLSELVTDPRLSFHERVAVRSALKHIKELETEKSWRNPYLEAIALLQSAARSHEGGYG